MVKKSFEVPVATYQFSNEADDSLIGGESSRFNHS